MLVAVSGNQLISWGPIRVGANSEYKKIVNFSDNQSPFPDGLVASLTGAGNRPGCDILGGRSPPGRNWKNKAFSSVLGDAPEDNWDGKRRVMKGAPVFQPRRTQSSISETFEVPTEEWEQ